MSKWKHPYVIEVKPGPIPEFVLLALSSGKRHDPHYYRPVESYKSIEKALTAKRKAYARLEK